MDFVLSVSTGSAYCIPLGLQEGNGRYDGPGCFGSLTHPVSGDMFQLVAVPAKPAQPCIGVGCIRIPGPVDR
jgi:hypothetical protein